MTIIIQIAAIDSAACSMRAWWATARKSGGDFEQALPTRQSLRSTGGRPISGDAGLRVARELRCARCMKTYLLIVAAVLSLTPSLPAQAIPPPPPPTFYEGYVCNHRLDPAPGFGSAGAIRVFLGTTPTCDVKLYPEVVVCSTGATDPLCVDGLLYSEAQLLAIWQNMERHQLGALPVLIHLNPAMTAATIVRFLIR
jgi:hypothetical protein